jgi:hypothetical protein
MSRKPYGSRLRSQIAGGGGPFNPLPQGGGYGSVPPQTGILETPPADVLPTPPGSIPRGAEALLRMFSIFDRMRYANFTQIPLALTTVDQIVLPRPTQIRVYLTILNTDAANTIFVNFGTAATPLSIPFAPANGFEWLFVIPQDDIHMVASAAPTVGTLIFAELPPPVA